MVSSRLRVSLVDDAIVVRDLATNYYAIYARPNQRATTLAAHGLAQYLTLLRRRPTDDRALIAKGAPCSSHKSENIRLGCLILRGELAK
jgi:hypothetical protein